MIIWKKGSHDLLNPYFNQSEFQCQCHYPDCIEQKISEDLLKKLTQLRQEVDHPIQITSGYRCHEHQWDLHLKGFETAKGISQHELGMASDIIVPDVPLHLVWIKAQNYFQAIGYSNRFIHLDLRADKQRHWYYKN
jgi:uncharacterized protein YcbK (DUF882 family)